MGRTALFVMLAATAGCAGPMAIVGRPSGPPIEAEIDGSDSSTLWLRGPSGNRVALGQYEVSDVDHPGNALAIAGLCYAGASGLLMLPALLPRDPKSGPGSGFEGMVIFMGITGIVTGLAVAAYNGVVWARSKARARAFENARPPDWVVPPALPGYAEPIEPLRPADGKDDEDPDKTPPRGMHR